MTPTSRSLTIHAFVSEAEHGLVRHAVTTLADCVAAASDAAPAINLALMPAARSDQLSATSLPPVEGGQRVVVLSLLPDVVSEPPLALDDARGHWQACIQNLQEAGANDLFVCNVFRHVPGEMVHRYLGKPESLRERIQRFNRMLIDLSHDTGIAVVDLDCALADRGADALQTDYLLAGERAAVAGGECLAATLLMAGLDEWIDPEVQARALAAMETRQEARNWLAFRKYQVAITAFVKRLGAFRKEAMQGKPDAQRDQGKFVLESIEELKNAGFQGNLGLHREFLAALRDIGEGQLECHAARQSKDAGRITQANERIKRGDSRLAIFLKAFDDYVPADQ